MNIPNYPIEITVGIPMYNAELYIENTLDSVINQNLINFEILIVDDCGTDNSLSIVERIKNENENRIFIRIIKHSTNKGVGEARNTIINEAKGKYIFFMDSDDALSLNAISSLYNKVEHSKTEAVFGSFNICKNGKTEVFRKLPDLDLIGEDKFASFFYNDIKENILCSACNILLSRDFLRKNNLLFSDIKYAEDLLFDYKMFPLIKNAILTSTITYTYITRPNSLSNYQSRKSISINEAHQALDISQQIKNTFAGLENKMYFPIKCAKDMKQILYFVCGIIKHRNQFDGEISDQEIRSAITPPLHLSTILRFKEQKAINLLFYLLGILPSYISVKVVTFLGKKKGFI